LIDGETKKLKIAGIAANRAALDQFLQTDAKAFKRQQGFLWSGLYLKHVQITSWPMAICPSNPNRTILSALEICEKNILDAGVNAPYAATS